MTIEPLLSLPKRVLLTCDAGHQWEQDERFIAMSVVTENNDGSPTVRNYSFCFHCQGEWLQRNFPIREVPNS